MTQKSYLELDSYRLAQYAVQVPCYICNGGNTYDAELCRHCLAPMALAHQANTQKVRPMMLAAIGPSGAGKTVYLGMLMDMLSRQSDGLQLLARGAFSVNLQQATASSLARGEFPTKTPNEPDRWNWVHAQVRWAKQRKPLELIMPDMAGEALLEEVDHAFSYQVVRSMISQCAGVMVLIDATRLLDGSPEQDYFTMKLLTYLVEMDKDSQNGWCQRPVALVFTKADECEECFADPANFAQTHAVGLTRLCKERFRNHCFFAASVAGACAYRLTQHGRIRVPLRIEPRGIVEPFEWLLNNLKL